MYLGGRGTGQFQSTVRVFDGQSEKDHVKTRKTDGNPEEYHDVFAATGRNSSLQSHQRINLPSETQRITRRRKLLLLL